MRMHPMLSNWLSLAVVLLFATAVFRIADGATLPGIVFFVGAAVIASAAGVCRKKEKGEALQKKNTDGGWIHAED